MLTSRTILGKRESQDDAQCGTWLGDLPATPTPAWIDSVPQCLVILFMFTVSLRILYRRGIKSQGVQFSLFGIDPCLRSVL
jgi:hypothetical protein